MEGGGAGCSGDSAWGEVVLSALDTVSGGEVVLGALETVSGGRWCWVLWRQ